MVEYQARQVVISQQFVCRVVKHLNGTVRSEEIGEIAQKFTGSVHAW